VERKAKINTALSAARIVEDIVACKWSLSVLEAVRRGVRRPGALQRSIPGISTKVLNQRLVKMVRYRIMSKRSFGEIPPRVEYDLTQLGIRLVKILDQVEALQKELDHGYADSSRIVGIARATSRR
jgi:DNA-binding HxlR family transcriptional regulator